MVIKWHCRDKTDINWQQIRFFNRLFIIHTHSLIVLLPRRMTIMDIIHMEETDVKFSWWAVFCYDVFSFVRVRLQHNTSHAAFSTNNFTQQWWRHRKIFQVVAHVFQNIWQSKGQIKKQGIILPLELPEKTPQSRELLEALTWSKASLGKCMQVNSRQEEQVEDASKARLSDQDKFSISWFASKFPTVSLCPYHFQNSHHKFATL